jgi:hypothetical protein
MSGEAGGEGSGALSWTEKIAEWGGRAAHLAEGGGGLAKGLGLAKNAAKIGGPLGKAMPFVGGALSLVSGGINAYEAVENFSKGGYHCDKAWNNVGGTILGSGGRSVWRRPRAWRRRG